MPQPPRVAFAFSKWEALGNDFVLVVSPEGPPPQADSLAREVCDRHYGIGADGVIFVTPGSPGVGMEIYNPDGSQASMCGNGLRCVAALVRRDGLVQGDPVGVSTPSGSREARILAEGEPWMVEVDMGEPERMEGPEFIMLDEAVLPCAPISMGNPHRVVFVDNLATVELERHGPVLERRHPQGLNVEFVQVLSSDHLAVKVWERGVGATLACGTGACAALVAASMAGLAGKKARVDLPGGTLDIRWDPDGHVRMVGPARELFRGTWRPDGGRPAVETAPTSPS